MSNTINVNYMTRAYNQYQQKNAAKDQEKEDTRFADSVREKSEASGSIVGNSKIGSVSAKDMTMVEYKQYITIKYLKFQCTTQEQANQYLLQFQRRVLKQ